MVNLSEKDAYFTAAAQLPFMRNFAVLTTSSSTSSVISFQCDKVSSVGSEWCVEQYRTKERLRTHPTNSSNSVLLPAFWVGN